MLPIGERLKTVASLVSPCCTVADIGTDHGYVPAFLAMTGKCAHVIASDIAEGPCAAARETLSKYGLQEVMEVRKASGLQGLAAGEAQTVVIAGMGGATILCILAELPDITQTVGTFVLQPMSAVGTLRRWLSDHYFIINEEALCKENGRIYIILKVAHARQKQELSDIEMELGPCVLNERPALWNEYVAEKAKRVRQMLKQMSASETATHSEKYRNMQKLLEQMERLLFEPE